MRNVRGAKALSRYLDTQGVPISESTIFSLLRQGKIPHQRPSPRILVFNLDAIDEWLGNK
ncbi:helix-turn-helix transcriptional regulator [Paraliobacillus ryukyuensis]|nr:hypothetical protein [Paraliobacillus ryukyuensis]